MLRDAIIELSLTTCDSLGVFTASHMNKQVHCSGEHQ